MYTTPDFEKLQEGKCSFFMKYLVQYLTLVSDIKKWR